MVTLRTENFMQDAIDMAWGMYSSHEDAIALHFKLGFAIWDYEN